MTSTADERGRFGAELRRLRGRRTLAEIHRLLLVDYDLDISTARLSGWERGEYAPTNHAIVDTLDLALEGNGSLRAALGLSPSRAVPVADMPLAEAVRALTEEVRRLGDRVEALEQHRRTGPRAGRPSR